MIARATAFVKAITSAFVTGALKEKIALHQVHHQYVISCNFINMPQQYWRKKPIENGWRYLTLFLKNRSGNQKNPFLAEVSTLITVVFTTLYIDH